MNRRQESTAARAALVAAMLTIATVLWPAGVRLGFAENVIQAAPQGQLPQGVTKEMIAEGEKLYAGEGRCQPCHGPGGKGVTGMTASLTDTTWQFSGDGSYEKLVEVITKGLTADATGAMPMPEGTRLAEDQVKAIAAYVWSLRQTQQ